MKCTLCGYEFNEEQAEAACKSCAIMKGCRLIRCPNCNFEMPPEPKWLKSFKKISFGDNFKRFSQRYRKVFYTFLYHRKGKKGKH